jgi:hypothetical protein
MTTLARAAPRRGDGITTVHNSKSEREKRGPRREPWPKGEIDCMCTMGNRALERNSFCASCGASFTPRRSSARFCSTRCRTAAHRSSTAACNGATAHRKARSAIKSAAGIVATRRVSVTRNPRIVVDERWSGMYRLRLPDGSLSDMTNLTRAREALASFAERERP